MLNIQENVLLSKYTTFRIGGPARFFVEANSEEEILEALKFSKEKNLEYFVMGGGSNLLASDNGFDGIVIKVKMNKIEIDAENEQMKVEAGVPLAKVVRDSAENNLAGMEWAAGIPGTMGGAVRGNAGAFGGETAGVIEAVRVLDSEKGVVFDLRKEDCNFSYRNSVFKKNKHWIILSATLQLQPGNKEESQKKIQEIIQQRIAKQPQGMPSAGSFFVNPVANNQKLVEEFEAEKGTTSKEGKVPAGWIIDKAGLKGKTMGGAMVNEIHPNYIVNTGAATAEDVIMLVSFVKQRVRDKFGVELNEEVQYLGF